MLNPKKLMQASLCFLMMIPLQVYAEEEISPIEDETEEIIEETATVPLYTDDTETPEIPAEFRFDDVMDPGVYYYEPVYWALDNKITKGTSDTTFSPEKTCTRGQFVTFLWRAKGSPKPSSSTNPFSDVPEGASFFEAVLWAVENKITTGKSATSFAPYDNVTRSQAATFLYRSAGSPEVKGPSDFVDVKKGMSYTNAIAWAADKKITTGTDATHFKPDNLCIRGQVVTFLMRMFRDSDNLNRGWRKTDGKWQYIDQNDQVVKGLQVIGQATYYLDNNGFMQTGFQTINNKKYFFETDGRGLTGWKKEDGKWYYYDNGLMATGWKKVGSKWYYMNPEGVMQTGWQHIGNNWYYLDSSGAMKTGWMQEKELWYYFESSGAMAAAKVLTINGKQYEFLNNGVMYDKERIISEAKKMVGQDGTKENKVYELTKKTLGMGATIWSVGDKQTTGTSHQISLSEARTGDLVVFRKTSDKSVVHMVVLLEGYSSFQGNWNGKVAIVDYRDSLYYNKNGCVAEFWRIDSEIEWTTE
ncbi:MAG: S-layer homology domain-containing protein [Solobacterium sp.]|nr:S-layer homology domain-containing protein [Solobacterium sp.]